MSQLSSRIVGRAASTCRVLVLVILGWPAAWSHAAVDKAGVVTALTGQAQVVRTSLSQPLPLKFKDEVFYRDRINTAENSVVRVLLGGKALITIRELSTLTLAEEVGRSTVDLQKGAVLAAVARKQMQAGEVIEIRTPNAVAAIRGTVLIVEVIPPPPGGQAEAITNLHVLKGLVEIHAQGASPATAVAVGVAQSVTVTGNAVGQVHPTPPGVAAQLVQSVHTAPQHIASPASANQQIIQTGHMQAAALAQILTSGSGQPQQGSPQGQSQQGGQHGQQSGSGPQPGTLLLGSQGPSPAVNLLQGIGNQGASSNPSIVNTQSKPSALVQTYIQTGSLDLSSSHPSLSGSQNLRVFSGNTNLNNTVSVLSFSNTTQTQSGAGGTGNLIQALSGSHTTLAGPLFKVSNSTVSGGNNLLAVTGTLSGSTSGSLISSNQSTLTLGNIAGIAAGGSLTLSGPLLTSSGGNLTLTNDLVSVGGTLRSNSTSSLIRFDGAIANMNGSGTSIASVNGGTMVLNGPLLNLDSGSSTVTVGQDILKASSATITGPTGGSMVNALTGTLTVHGDAFALGSNSKMTLGGTLLNANGGTVTVDGAVLKASGGSVLSLSGSSSVLALSGGTHSLANVVSPSGATIFSLTGSATTGQIVEGVQLSLGTAQPLQGTGCGNQCVTGSLVWVSGATLNSQQILKVDTALLEASQPLLNMLGAAVVNIATDAVVLASKAKLSTTNSAFNLNSGTLTVGNSLVSLQNGSLLSVGTDLVNLQGGSKLVINSGYLLNVSGGSVAVISGAIANFNGSTANTITVKNSNAPTFVSGTYPFIRVLLTSGATSSQLTLQGTLARNGSSANFLFPNGGSLIRIDGTTAKVVLRGN